MLRLNKKKIAWLRWGMFFLTLMAGVSILVWRFLPHERLLLEQARRVADTRQWGAGGNRFNESIGNYWLSDHEILFDRYEGAQHNERVIYKRDIQTGQETKLPGLTDSRDLLDEAEVEDAQSISPDGKWFLCSARWGRCLLAEVNGARHEFYPDVEDGECYRTLLWLPDSRHWLERYSVNSRIYRILLHDTQHPELSIPLTLKTNSTAKIMDIVVPPDTAIIVAWPKEGRDDFGEPLITANSPKTQQVSLSLLPWRESGKPFARYSVTIPFGLERYHFAISPDAKHVAWQMTAQRPAPLRAWLHRYLPFVKTVEDKTTTVWVSDINGGNRRELGHMIEADCPSAENGSGSGSLLNDLKWLPDSKHLSFQYNDALYVVPIF